MAHVLEGHDGPCRNVHGHSYRLEVTVIGVPNADSLSPKQGMVLDFSELKTIVKTHVIDRFDHVLLINSQSQIASNAHLCQLHNLQRVDYQPTCENLLIHIAQIITPLLPQGVKLHHLTLWETSSSYAEWFASDNLQE